ncbi:DUF922 domain-containing protein [Endothiovibrio diazotrophicus]
MKPMRTIATLLLLAGVACSPTLLAAPQVDAKVRNYLVDGTTIEEIRADLAGKSLSVGGGKGLYSAAKWGVHWQRTNRRKGAHCRVLSVATRVDIQYFLPKLKPNPQRPAEVTRKWERFIRAVALHQAGYKKLAIAAAQRIEQEMPAVPAQSSCDRLRRVTDELGNKILDQYQALARRYSEGAPRGDEAGFR